MPGHPTIRPSNAEGQGGGVVDRGGGGGGLVARAAGGKDVGREEGGPSLT